jgi:hypothetical protein
MSTSKFSSWFKNSFGSDVPEAYLEFLYSNPKSVYNDGRGGVLWDVEYVMSQTEDYEMAEKGVCLIGGGDSLTHYLLRAKDGRVFIVDSTNHSDVDAWFSSIECMIALMGFQAA